MNRKIRIVYFEDCIEIWDDNENRKLGIFYADSFWNGIFTDLEKNCKIVHVVGEE